MQSISMNTAQRGMEQCLLVRKPMVWQLMIIAITGVRPEQTGPRPVSRVLPAAVGQTQAGVIVETLVEYTASKQCLSVTLMHMAVT